MRKKSFIGECGIPCDEILELEKQNEKSEKEKGDLYCKVWDLKKQNEELRKEKQANALLIATAPEMLNMLLYIAEEMHRGGLTPKGNDAFEEICYIIEKATGRKIEDIKKD